MGDTASPVGGASTQGAQADALLPEVYQELRRMARRHLRRQPGGATLNTTAVVHEAYLRLAAGSSTWTDRTHFLALASTAMRHLLVDAARRRRAAKRGAGALHLTLDTTNDGPAVPGPDLLALDDALRDLAALDPALERLVECRFFAGLTVSETAEALGRSPRSVERDWARARAHLYRALGGDHATR
ncbi:MAG: sigma-70 family RNA polymerase sigma factor [Burkholderiaceae bacterium]|nr:sigma-70 family RNA polymerase sigma factor [Burkholderiaceae bacterium]